MWLNILPLALSNNDHLLLSFCFSFFLITLQRAEYACSSLLLASYYSHYLILLLLSQNLFITFSCINNNDTIYLLSPSFYYLLPHLIVCLTLFSSSSSFLYYPAKSLRTCPSCFPSCSGSVALERKEDQRSRRRLYFWACLPLCYENWTPIDRPLLLGSSSTTNRFFSTSHIWLCLLSPSSIMARVRYYLLLCLLAR